MMRRLRYSEGWRLGAIICLYNNMRDTIRKGSLHSPYSPHLFCTPRLHVERDSISMLYPSLVSVLLRGGRHHHPPIGEVCHRRSSFIQINKIECILRVVIIIGICEFSFRTRINTIIFEYVTTVCLRDENCRLGGNESS